MEVEKRSTDNGLLLSVCYLADQRELSSFKHAYQDFKNRTPNLRMLYTGPWAPTLLLILTYMKARSN